MSATDELRRLLDERGVEWHGDTAIYWGDADAVESVFADNALEVSLYAISPEQAIAATLGAGTCELSGYADAAFRVVQAVDQQDFIDYAEVCECSACGASFIVPHEYERIAPDEDELWPKFNYCPNCGAKVVDE